MAQRGTVVVQDGEGETLRRSLAGSVGIRCRPEPGAASRRTETSSGPAAAGQCVQIQVVEDRHAETHQHHVRALRRGHAAAAGRRDAAATRPARHGLAARTRRARCRQPAGATRTTDGLFDEARAAAALVHPNVAGLYDCGLTDGMPWFVMEYVAGVTLRSVLRPGGLPEAEVRTSPARGTRGTRRPQAPSANC
jgi:serine/threonine protein kinase